MDVRAINAQAANGKLAYSLLSQFYQGFLGAAIHHIWIHRAKHINYFLIVLALNDELGKFRTGGGNLLQVDFLQKLLFHPLPSNVGNHQSTLQKVVATQFHLFAESRDVGGQHPLEERTRNPRSSCVPMFNRVGANVGFS